MKFVVVTYGTEGDTRPLAALCAALISAGHEARLLADHATLGSAKTLGVPVTALAGDIKATLQPALTSAGAVAGRSRFKGTANALAGIANSNAERWLRETVRAGEGCDAVIVSGLAAFVGLSAAEYLGVTAIGTGLIPITPTAAFASPFFPPSRVPSFLNRVSHEFVNGFLWRAFRKRINAARASVCSLPPRRDLWNDHPMLYGISPSLLPRPQDWPSNARMCGQWIAPSAGWSPPQDLTDFLAKGEAPIYVGFGSMTSFDTQKALQEVVTAAGGRRTLFHPAWSTADTSMLPANVHVIGDTPHEWLFPRTSMVIHHGGSGTSHSAARAGVPSVVVPFAGDQFFWADRLRRAGVAPGPVDGKNLRASSLSRGIEFAEREDVRSCARTLGKRMQAENGLAQAVSSIEEIVAKERSYLPA
ncbi:glycosyltransferase family 1 protein [Burkholderia sp. R-69980]|nr:glycosyltransferase family 1 protein [Burkholderia sp. R-69980]MCI0147016.1 glycosyltransferase [Paraburkholderia sediminicola]